MFRKDINDDLKVELIGILANIPLGKEWIEHLSNNQFMDFILQHMANGYVEDDIILEVVCLIAKMVEDDECAEFISSNPPLGSI